MAVVKVRVCHNCAQLEGSAWGIQVPMCINRRKIEIPGSVGGQDWQDIWSDTAANCHWHIDMMRLSQLGLSSPLHTYFSSPL